MPDAASTSIRQAFRVVVVAPTYDNAVALPVVLRDLAALGLPVRVVDDGSTDATAAILAAWSSGGDGGGGRAGAGERSVLTHARNRGKAAALQTGFAAALADGFTHALTIDTDGQHDVADAAALVGAASGEPAALWVGHRPVRAGEYPLASRVGRVASNTLVRLESGLRVGDSQCGLRVYPLAAIKRLPIFAGRYGYETEILTRAAWADISVRELPVRCIYAVPGGRVSHFRPVVDSLRAARMHTHLIGVGLWRWLDPTAMWTQIRSGRGDGRFPRSAAVGMFMAVVPTYGIKTILCLLLARGLRLQPLVVLTVSSLNTPPTGPLLAAASIVTGGLVLRGRLPTWSHYAGGGWAAVRTFATEWAVGALIVGAVLAVLTYFAARLSVAIAAGEQAEAGHSHGTSSEVRLAGRTLGEPRDLVAADERR